MGFRDRCQTGVSLSTVSTFGIGGPAALFFRAEQVEDLQDAFRFIHSENIPYLVVGRGSNCLFSDNGFSGLVIHHRIESFCDEGNGRFVVGGGYGFPTLGIVTAREGWSGLEFAAGIPASVGGAVWMNAGSHGQQTGEAISSVEYVNETGALVQFQREELSFGYRLSSFQNKRGAIARVVFQLKKDAQVQERQREMTAYRKQTQPYKERSAGCVFRNPPGASAGRLIEEAGLKGTSRGGAEVSSVHANFIVAREGATAEDVRSLIDVVRECVSRKTGVRLECEIRMISSS